MSTTPYWYCEACMTMLGPVVDDDSECYCSDYYDREWVRTKEPKMKLKNGPWHIAEYGQNDDGTPKFYAIKHGSETIANLGVSDKNARLIAAAPDLLSALKTAAAFISDGGDRVATLKTVLEAIAKAE